ncbi:hypothetical protein Tco_0910413 [Tanacetum coccineum]|uniref:Reverse transcriptase domain-containing protein n=1 Tax=Tanacetum coccineum TaxID=301880 RepID=A0ABQ5CV41_9ASTR
MILIERKRVRAPFTLPPAIKRAITVEIATPPDERFISPPPSPSHKRCRLTSSPSSGSPPPLNVLPPRKRIMRVRLVRHDRLIEETHDQLQDISVAKIESTKQDIEALRPRAEVVEETRGAVGWTCWFEKMEIVFRINNCADNCQVKYASCTLLDSALTWWNSYMQAVGIDAARMIRDTHHGLSIGYGLVEFRENGVCVSHQRIFATTPAYRNLARKELKKLKTEDYLSLGMNTRTMENGLMNLTKTGKERDSVVTPSRFQISFAFPVMVVP